MKKKIFSFMAAALLSSTSAFAQGQIEDKNGDVNRDGVVDVADVTSVIDIMKKGGGVTKVGGDCSCNWSLIYNADGTWTISDGTNQVVIPNWIYSSSVYEDPYGVIVQTGIDQVYIPQLIQNVDGTITIKVGGMSYNIPNGGGETPYIGSNGNWFIGTTDTGVAAQGPAGTMGYPGRDGESPYIGSNGHWFVGTTDTGVYAQGPKGEKGDMPDISDLLNTIQDLTNRVAELERKLNNNE